MDDAGASENLWQNGGGEAECELENYWVASSYEEIYDCVRKLQQQYKYEYSASGEIADGTINDMAVPEENASSDIICDMGTTTNEVQNGQDFSQTNVQQEGIDESDIVKTDGDYIYKLTSKNVIEIVDIRADEMCLAGEIAPELSEVDQVCDMYVDGDFLYVVLSQYGTGLYSTDLVSDYSLTDTYYRDINQTSELLTYDISVHSQPKLIGTLTQDGEYYTSRKVGDYIYLFTRKYIDSYYYTDADVETVVPMVQGQKAEYGNIYLSENPYMELIAASIDVNQPEKVVDDLVIMDNYSTVYMGTSAIYFYRSSYENGQEMTEFTKFSYKDGQMYPVADNMVKGDITDTFAISQHGDMLRVLTTDWSGPTVQNRLYILDANLNVLGEIEHIADGESIYAARYVENTAYFITYRNTDPLFVADLTDCESPTLLGCVEVSGFSEYLHMYGEGLVLGIGYETDENSRYEGLKLCMFDVSDPLQPVASDSYVMPEVSRTTALYDYKAILVDAKKNLIGFVTESWNDGFTCVYELFSWNGAAFQEIMSVPLCENGDYNWYMEETRGLYAGNYFYVVADDGIVSFDMENGFAEVDRVTFIK